MHGVYTDFASGYKDEKYPAMDLPVAVLEDPIAYFSAPQYSRQTSTFNVEQPVNSLVIIMFYVLLSMQQCQQATSDKSPMKNTGNDI
jgi:hypothetical protein